MAGARGLFGWTLVLAVAITPAAASQFLIEPEGSTFTSTFGMRY